MLTRLQVRGFKNLVDVDVAFGPLTCIVGPNGVGKSNLFEVIAWLAELADRPFAEARTTLRGGKDPAKLFDAHGDGRMDLSAEMIVPARGEDEYGREIEAAATYLRYSLSLRLSEEGNGARRRRIVLEHESLEPLDPSEQRNRLGFAPENWLEAVIGPKLEPSPMIRMDEDSVCVDESSRALAVPRQPLERTVLSTLGRAEDGPTAVLARQEMRRWHVFHLDPAKLREPDDLDGPDRLSEDGSGHAAALYRLTTALEDPTADPAFGESVYQRVANRLSELVEGVGTLRVDRDEARRTLEVRLLDLAGFDWPSEVLSDGTLRFLALAVLESDESETGLFCIEEPENGVHPQRIDALLDLLYDIALDPSFPPGEGNPWRQVIVGSHSPFLAARVDAGDLLFARARPRAGRSRGAELTLECLEGTWREKAGMPAVAPGRARTHLRGASPPSRREEVERVLDRLGLDEDAETE